jgi:sulfofructosephosphate aldolase
MTAPTLAAIARPGGGLAMVAMDQRESLATMMAAATGQRPDRARLVDFKLAVAETLSPAASGFLIDAYHEPAAAARLLPASCGLILAADDLTQEPGGPVTETGLDDAVLSGALHSAAALKLLVIWRRDARRGHRVEMTARFIAACRARGVLSVVEPVVKPAPDEAAADWDQDQAVREAARELSGLGPTLTKVQVPLNGQGGPAEQRAASEALDAVIATPWVVLSQGVERDRYAGAVEAACQAGASGFLAGRALWSDVVGRPDAKAALRELAAPRLEKLVALVDAYARPWQQR